MIVWIKERLANCEDYIKGVGITLYVIALIELVLGFLGVLFFAFIVDLEEFSFGLGIGIIARITAFFAGTIAVVVTYLCAIFIANLVYSWGDKIEHTKKQTELLKIIAMK